MPTRPTRPPRLLTLSALRCLLRCGVAPDETFTPYLEQIDQVDQNLAALEQATKEIDEYSKRLEAKFKKVLAK